MESSTVREIWARDVGGEGRAANVTEDQERIAAAMQESLATFARLREQMREAGPQAVAASLQSMPDSAIRQGLLALAVTAERAEDR
jgi:hypothetical protein